MESSPLLSPGPGPGPGPGLSWAMAALCIVDMFGVFPVVALPRPIIDCGWVGWPLAALVVSLQIYTAGLLGRCWLIAESLEPRIAEQARSPYAALAELSFGRRMRCCVSLLLNLTLFGGGVPNLLVASQMLQLVGLKEALYDVSFCYWLLVLGVVMCPVMWLGSPKDMKWVAVTSCLTVLTVAAMTWACILMDATVSDRTPPPPATWEAVAVAYGILAFQFDVHPMVLTVQVDMARKRQLGTAILAAFAVTGSLFVVTTGLATWRYGAATQRNLLQGLPGNGLLYVTIVLVTLQICLSMAVGGSPLFQDIEHKLAVPTEFGWRRCVLRAAILFAAVLVAELVPRFDLVMGLLGGALTGPLMFVFPPLFYLRLSAMRARADQCAAVRAQQAQLYGKPGARKQPPYNPHFTATTLGYPDVVYSNQTYDGVLAPLSYDGVLEPLSFEPVLIAADHVSAPRRRGPPYDAVHASAHFVNFRPARGLSTSSKLASAAIIVLGSLATLAATYFTLRDTLRYAQLTPPCFSW